MGVCYQGSSSRNWPQGYAYATLSLLSNVKKCNQADWYADSGASQHMSDQLCQFQNCNPIKPGSWPVKGIGLIDNKPLQVHGVGEIPIRCRVDGNWLDAVHAHSQRNLCLRIGANLFSIRCATKLGAVEFKLSLPEMLTIVKEEIVLDVVACHSSNLYRLHIQSTRRPEPAAVSSVARLAKQIFIQ